MDLCHKCGKDTYGKTWHCQDCGKDLCNTCMYDSHICWDCVKTRKSPKN
jgi:hypothetical protein